MKRLKNHKHSTEQIVRLLEELNDKNLTMIDFDQWTSSLEEQKQRLESWSDMNDELEILRKDYESRIRGMAKAIAVADRKQGAMAQSVELVSRLPEFSATELVDCYHRTAARFRDMFPASYTQLSTQSTNGSLMRNPGDFK